MTIKEIVREYLEAHGFDGLAGDECGCMIDDLWPCAHIEAECGPAYRWRCPENGKYDCSIVDAEEGCEWFPDGCYRTEKQP